MRITRAAKRRAEESTADPPPPATKKRVVLGEISSNVLGNSNVNNPSLEPSKSARGRLKKKSKKPEVPTPASEKTPAEDVVGPANAAAEDIDAGTDDPQMCGPYVAGIYEYLRNMEVRLSESALLYFWLLCYC